MEEATSDGSEAASDASFCGCHVACFAWDEWWDPLMASDGFLVEERGVNEFWYMPYSLLEIFIYLLKILLFGVV